MSKIIKVVAGAFGLIALFMMFLPQVVLQIGGVSNKETLNIAALVGGSYSWGTEITNPVYSGLVGYILVGVGGLLILLCGLLPFFNEHDILNYIVTALGIICIIVGVIMIFLIRKTFMDNNGFMSKEVLVGFGAMIGGGVGSLAGAVGGLGLVLDFAK